jgi:hypothetical protein
VVYFKAQGLNTMNESLSSISPLDCRINFSVPSNPTLSKETSKYTLDAGSPGLLNISLHAFANANKGKDVKLSIDDKKLTIGRGDKGDENLSGFEVSPTLMYRKDRILDKDSFIVFNPCALKPRKKLTPLPLSNF